MTTLRFDWHRDGKAGYEARATQGNAYVHVGRASRRDRGNWFARVYVNGVEVGNGFYTMRLDDAKRTAEQDARRAM